MEFICIARAWRRRSEQVLVPPCGDAATVVTGVSRLVKPMDLEAANADVIARSQSPAASQNQS
jgi:hypothetical protein